ncbi:MAG: precorrin-6A reductase [Synergistaceae bacterium]|jgi:precorrin-2 dehydrogenase/sirohydrochlorin ferrochelatase/precorrin-6A/cobalt-precorrin-6A reductase|nr:precorrin-6A reductase [Synergistaceae bacterium]
MKRILVFGGTTEGREIAASGLPVIYSVTTEYGGKLADFPGTEVLVGRMDEGDMAAFMRSRPVAGVIDATHPYAVEVTKNIRAACTKTGVPYARATRAASDAKEVTAVPNCQAAVETLQSLLLKMEGNALLTVGSKDLEKFAALPAPLRKRLYARVLPLSSVVAACEKLGFDAGHIVAMKGPFTKEMNFATLAMTGAEVLVTKDGGTAGGLVEKLEAARERGAEVLLIRRPDETGVTVLEAIAWGFELLGLARPKKFPLFPFFTNVAGRRSVVVGGGEVAARRAKTLLLCGAEVTIISPSFGAAFGDAEFATVARLVRPYRKGDLSGAFVAVAATNDRNVNREAGAEAREGGIPVSVADAPEECTFFFPALAVHGDVAAAVSTGGNSPALCRRLTARLRAVWPGWVKEEGLEF